MGAAEARGVAVCSDSNGEGITYKLRCGGSQCLGFFNARITLLLDAKVFSSACMRIVRLSSKQIYLAERSEEGRKLTEWHQTCYAPLEYAPAVKNQTCIICTIESCIDTQCVHAKQVAGRERRTKDSTKRASLIRTFNSSEDRRDDSMRSCSLSRFLMRASMVSLSVLTAVA
jgi:hypothetical protein